VKLLEQDLAVPIEYVLQRVSEIVGVSSESSERKTQIQNSRLSVSGRSEEE